MQYLRQLFVNFLNRKNNSKQINYYKVMKEQQWNSLEENINLQKERLYNIVQYAFNNIPYYKDYNLDFASFQVSTIFEDIKRLPLLNRGDIKNNFDRLQVSNNNTYISKTGGSTGKPVSIVHDYVFHDWIKGTKLLYDEWAGRKSGQSKVVLWGSMKDLNKQSQSLKNRAGNWARNITMLNSYNMRKSEMDRYIDTINRKKPVLILAYAQSIYELARYVKQTGRKIYSPCSIMTSASTLYPEYRKLINKVFQCPVYDRYGSKEVGDVACECEKHEGLHLNIFNSYIEVVDQDANNCDMGQVGELVVTTLNNLTMPLIRYKIGDMGSLTDKECSCGRGLPMMKNIAGRVTDYFIDENGEMIYGGIFTQLLIRKNYVDSFQVIQEEQNTIVINLVLKEDYLNFKQDFHGIRKKVKSILGESVEVRFNIVDNIKPTVSGKLKYTISKVDRGLKV